MFAIDISEIRNIDLQNVLSLYQANHWSSANKPELLFSALLSSHMLVTAWDEDRLVGLGNAISDGHLVVYYPHLLVHPEYQGRGIGKMIMQRMQMRYCDFHQQAIIADGNAINFYQKVGFERAGQTQSLWIYQGDEH
jgi:GNAT superfamily N-acetyltransferase